MNKLLHGIHNQFHKKAFTVARIFLGIQNGYSAYKCLVSFTDKVLQKNTLSRVDPCNADYILKITAYELFLRALFSCHRGDRKRGLFPVGINGKLFKAFKICIQIIRIDLIKCEFRYYRFVLGRGHTIQLDLACGDRILGYGYVETYAPAFQIIKDHSRLLFIESERSKLLQYFILINVSALNGSLAAKFLERFSEKYFFIHLIPLHGCE